MIPFIKAGGMSTTAIDHEPGGLVLGRAGLFTAHFRQQAGQQIAQVTILTHWPLYVPRLTVRKKRD